MNKEQQIEEFQNDIIDNLFDGGTYKLAESLYNAGYRKTFTSDFASDTQKAYKEGYEKGIEETVEKPVDTSKKEYPDLEDIVRGFVKMSNKEQQIEEIEQFIYDYVDSKQTERVYLLSSRVNELAKPFVHNKGLAEALCNAGYRKVPDCAVILTPKERDEELKACNEKQAELENEIERLKADNEALQMWNNASAERNQKLYETNKCLKSNMKSVLEIEKKNAVKEFAEKLKKKVHNYYPSIDSYCTSKHVILVKDIDELLKEYEQ